MEEKKHKNKWKVVVAAILYIFSALALFGAISFNSTYKPVSTTNTILYTGTIKDISPIGNFIINTNEQNFSLSIVLPEAVINNDYLLSLKKGDIISYRIKDLGTNNTINGVSTIVVSLSFDNKEIITLDSTNICFKNLRERTTTSFGVLCAIMFLIGTGLVIWHIKSGKKNKVNN